MTSSSLEDTMNEEQRREAESTMLSALDQLRKSRGQMTIEEEEAYYQKKNPSKRKKSGKTASQSKKEQGKPHSEQENRSDLNNQPDLDPDSARKQKQSASSESGVSENPQHSTAETKQSDTVKKEEDRLWILPENVQRAANEPLKNRKDKSGFQGKRTRSAMDLLQSRNPNRYEKKRREDHFEVSEKRPASQRKGLFGKNKTAVLLACALIVGLFGAYVWKESVYNPSHYLSEEQQQLHDWLIAYADEYNMMSDAEKNELLSRTEQIEQIGASQKETLQTYFATHTGSSLDELIQILTDKRQGELEDPVYLDLLQYTEHFSSYDDTERHTIVEKESVYQSLSDLQKKHIDDAMSKASGAGFEQTIANEREKMAVEKKEKETQLAKEISELQSDKDNYVQFVESEGKNPAEDDLVKEYDEKISALQDQLQTLSQE